MTDTIACPSLLMKLPSGVGQNILSKWLHGKSIATLDSAYCNHNERSRFLEILNHTDTLYTPSGSNCAPMLNWMNAKKITFSNLQYYSTVLSEPNLAELTVLISRTADRLKNVTINSELYTVLVLLKVIATYGCSLVEMDIFINALTFYSGAAEWPAYMMTIVRNSASTLTSFRFQQALGRTSMQLIEGLNLCALQKICVKIYCDEDLLHICKAAPNLRELVMAHANCSDIGLAAVGKSCAKLEHLEMHFATAVQSVDEGLAALAVGCRKLESLVLDSCRNLTDIGLTAVAANSIALKELAVMNNGNITDASLEALASSCGSRLLSLVVNSCPAVTGSGFATIAAQCESLELLGVSNLSQAREHIVNAIPQLGNLKSFLMADSGADDEVLMLIAQHMPYLEYLNVKEYGKPDYTQDGLMAVIFKCERLQVLDIAGDGETIRSAAALHRPGLQIFDRSSYDD